MGNRTSRIHTNAEEPKGETETGNNASLYATSNSHMKRSVLDVVRIMLPVYYTDEAITESELILAKRKWDLIIHDKSEYFNKMKGSPGYETNSCISLFYDRFYMRFFDLHPAAKPMFHSGLKSQGKFLVRMMTMTLQLANQEQKFMDAMVKLAEVHNNRGVKAIEYGVVGEVLFYTLKSCLGPEYDSDTHRVWVKIFCRMLKVIVPVAVTFEMKSGGAQMERLRAAMMEIKDKSKDDEEDSHATGSTPGKSKVVGASSQYSSSSTSAGAQNSQIH